MYFIKIFILIIMIYTKFNIGQQIRHSLLGYLGVIVDVDPEYSLNDIIIDEIEKNKEIKYLPWYHVIMEDERGQTVHTYLAESQISWIYDFHVINKDLEESSLDELSSSIKKQLKAPKLCH